MRYDNGGNTNMMVPHGVDLTLSELQEMAARQQQQIEAQQQQLVAKEQRLRFLKQQELRHEQIAAENERLRKLREKVESQELKLKKLRALRGQVSEHKGNNNNLTAELEMIKSLFNEKEKELSMAVTKVEELTKQLEELRNGRINGLPPGDNRNNSPAFLELEKLRKELMVRNKLNEAQNSKLAAHREVMVQRKDEMSNMDVRIAELQQRLRKNRNLQQQQHQEQQQHNQQAGIGGQRGGSLNAKIGLNRPLSANIAAVEPYIKHGSTKDMVPDQQGYSISKQDPKYQTLPPNIKLLGLDGKRLDAEANGNGGQEQHMDNEHFEKNNNNQQYHQTSGQELKVDTNQGAGDAKQGLGSPGKDLLSKETVHKVPDYKPSKGHTTAFAVMEQVLKKSEKTDGGKSVPPRGGVYGPSAYKPPSSLSNFTARPFGSTYSTAMLANRPSIIGTQSTQSTPTLTNSVSSPGAVFPKTSTPIAAGSYSNQQDDMREIFITGAPSSSSSTSFSGRPPTYTPAPPGNAQHNYPPVTISTSNAMASPVSSSELSPKPGSMQYQIANSRPQQAMYPQRAGNLPAPQSSLQDQEMSKLSPTSLAAGSRGNTPVSSGNFTATTAAGEGRPNVPGQIGISLSTKVTLSERHALGSNGDSNTSLGNQGSASLNQGSNSPSSPTDVLQYPQPTSATDSKKDITPNSVSSALSVLMSGPTTTVATTRPYRYAPKSVIANTYMRKLGSNTLDEYRKTMNQIYKDFTPAAAPGTQAAGGEAPTGEPDMAAGPRSPPGGAQLRAASPTKLPESFSGADDHSPSHVPPYQRAANHEMEAERIRYKANAPKTLRRRLSAGESDELAHLAPKAQYPVVSDKADLSTSQTHAAPSQDNVVRVDTIQDSYNNNTGYSGDVKGVPYNAPHGDGETLAPGVGTPPAVESKPAVIRRKKTNLKTKGSTSSSRRVSFDPLALLLDASLEGELELVKRTATEVSDPSAANDEGITALHNAICAGHYDIVKFLTEFGCNVNAPDSDGWTPLHCAASCNNLAMVKLLVEHGACIFATTISDQETAAEKCEEDEDGYDGCSEYLYSIQEKLGIVNKGVVYAVFDYNAQNPDELSFRNGNNLTVLRKGDEQEKDWWWARSGDREGYIPRNLLGSFPRVPLQSAYESRGKER